MPVDAQVGLVVRTSLAIEYLCNLFQEEQSTPGISLVEGSSHSKGEDFSYRVAECGLVCVLLKTFCFLDLIISHCK